MYYILFSLLNNFYISPKFKYFQILDIIKLIINLNSYIMASSYPLLPGFAPTQDLNVISLC